MSSHVFLPLTSLIKKHGVRSHLDQEFVKLRLEKKVLIYVYFSIEMSWIGYSQIATKNDLVGFSSDVTLLEG